MLIRRVRNGRVYYVAPGVAISGSETAGTAAERAAAELEGSYEVVTLPTSQLLAYDIRPWELAKRLCRQARERR